jgi:predicted MFS family arabinose efflux permease
LMLAGFAMMGLVFTTDPTIRSYPKTWHGFLHDGFFAVLGVMLMSGMLLLGRVFQKKEPWMNLAIYTWATLALVVPTFWLKGPWFYLFLSAILIWSEVVAFRLKSTQ